MIEKVIAEKSNKSSGVQKQVTLHRVGRMWQIFIVKKKEDANCSGMRNPGT